MMTSPLSDPHPKKGSVPICYISQRSCSVTLGHPKGGLHITLSTVTCDLQLHVPVLSALIGAQLQSAHKVVRRRKHPKYIIRRKEAPFVDKSHLISTWASANIRAHHLLLYEMISNRQRHPNMPYLYLRHLPHVKTPLFFFSPPPSTRRPTNSNSRAQSIGYWDIPSLFVLPSMRQRSSLPIGQRSYYDDAPTHRRRKRKKEVNPCPAPSKE